MLKKGEFDVLSVFMIDFESVFDVSIDKPSISFEFLKINF